MSSGPYEAISQVVGAAYTYQPSLAMRRRLTATIDRSHSSQTQDFSFFVKGGRENVVQSGQSLALRRDAETGELVPHWPEPELAILLGERHEVRAYTLANDLTAFSIETRGRDRDFDGTYVGKCWPRSCALGPEFVPPERIADDGALEIGMTIERDGQTIYRYVYSTARRKRPFSEIPRLIVEYRRRFGDAPPPSKRIRVEPDGHLPPGTVIMLGTGVIVPARAYSQRGDVVTIFSDGFGELRNRIEDPGAEAAA
ncbi:MAG: fumarylacetoacetate hydrolase family protein [Chloroflexi bacterium]|nr:MAG: fumarylacetoacetate hydrolase family protein [Chloroflexota bacterium]